MSTTYRMVRHYCFQNIFGKVLWSRRTGKINTSSSNTRLRELATIAQTRRGVISHTRNSIYQPLNRGMTIVFQRMTCPEFFQLYLGAKSYHSRPQRRSIIRQNVQRTEGKHCGTIGTIQISHSLFYFPGRSLSIDNRKTSNENSNFLPKHVDVEVLLNQLNLFRFNNLTKHQ